MPVKTLLSLHMLQYFISSLMIHSSYNFSESLSNSRRHTHSQPKPRGKTYGSYEELNSPPISRRLGGGGGGGGGEGGGGGDCREKAEPVQAGSSVIPDLHETEDEEITSLDQR